MNPRPQPISGRAIDLGYLSTLVTLTAAGILAIGLETSNVGTGANTPVSVIVLYFILMECFLLLWALSKASGRGTPYITCIFTLRLQAQAAVQVYLAIFLTVYLGEWLLLGITHCLNWITVKPDAHGFLSPKALSRLNSFLSIVCPLATVWMTTWRLDILNSGGYRFSDVHAGALNKTSIALSAPASVAVKRLEHYLDTLKLDRTPVLPISYYGKRPVVSCHAIDDSYIYDLTWAWCPSKIRIVLEKK